MTLKHLTLIALLCCVALTFAIAAKAQDPNRPPVYPVTSPVCPHTDTPRLMPFVDITLTNGRKIGFQRITQETLETWDRNHLVAIGGTRIPYTAIAVLDGRCA